MDVFEKRVLGIFLEHNSSAPLTMGEVSKQSRLRKKRTRRALFFLEGAGWVKKAGWDAWALTAGGERHGVAAVEERVLPR